MKKLLLLYVLGTLLVQCQNPFGKTTKQNDNQQEDYQQKRYEKYEKDKEIIHQNFNIAENKAIRFTQEKGYSVESIKYLSSSYVSNILSYTFEITTNDLSTNGSLIYVTITVKKQGNNWSVDFFRATTI